MREQQTPTERQLRFHMRMTLINKLGHLAAISILVGLLASLVIIALRLLVEWVQLSFLDHTENYESLSWGWRLLLPLGGGLLIGLLFSAAHKHYRSVGIVHTMERLNYHQANLPTGNAVMQFLGAAIAIIFGHSVGREGPAVHLGATSGSRIGQWLRLPNNSNRTLVACGVAAAIAASFNTPLAGVIFSMEVVLMEYALAGFIPVILAAVTATTLSQIVFGAEPVLSVPALHLGSLTELPYVLLAGLVIGALAALFIHALQFFSRQGLSLPLWLRITLGGLAVGLCAIIVPEVMSLGYDTVNSTMLGEIGVWALIAIVAFKLLATTAGLGMGIPGGLIGPTLVIGACAGTAFGLIAEHISPGSASNPAFYAMIGMGAMMGATLQAPLAALTALLELTANPNIILPGMLAIVGANLVSSQIFGKASVFIMLMRDRGLDYYENSVAQSLRQANIATAMKSSIHSCPAQLSRQQIDVLLQQQPQWLLRQPDDKPAYILPGADLARYLLSSKDEMIDIDQLPASRRHVVSIDLRATLQEGLEQLRQQRANALYVIDPTSPDPDQAIGIITREDIEEHYLYPNTLASVNK